MLTQIPEAGHRIKGIDLMTRNFPNSFIDVYRSSSDVDLPAIEQL